jgi:hypothetical protein
VLSTLGGLPDGLPVGTTPQYPRRRDVHNISKPVILRSALRALDSPTGAIPAARRDGSVVTRFDLTAGVSVDADETLAPDDFRNS